jgi:hypothetical protein
METRKMLARFELTDTSTGVHVLVATKTPLFRDTVADVTLIRRAKAFAGLTGARCTITKAGDFIGIQPRGVTLFLSIAKGVPLVLPEGF